MIGVTAYELPTLSAEGASGETGLIGRTSVLNELVGQLQTQTRMVLKT